MGPQMPPMAQPIRMPCRSIYSSRNRLAIDIAFLAAPTSDCMGNCRGVGGKSDCGSMGYAMTDARYAGHVVVERARPRRSGRRSRP